MKILQEKVEEPKQNMSDKECYYCHEYGHFKKSCPKRRSARRAHPMYSGYQTYSAPSGYPTSPGSATQGFVSAPGPSYTSDMYHQGSLPPNLTPPFSQPPPFQPPLFQPSTYQPQMAYQQGQQFQPRQSTGVGQRQSQYPN